MKNNLFKLLLVAVSCLTISACHKNAVLPKPVTPNTPSNGLYILNNGNLGVSSFSFYTIGTKQLTADQYLAANGKPLGIGANDVEVYGSKMYIVVTESGVINIVNLKTGKLIKQDSVLNTAPTVFESRNRAPRNITFDKGNAYISCHDGTVSILDTLTLSIKSTITIPRIFGQEGLVVANNKLYVASPCTFTTDIVTVIDLKTNQVIKNINVIPNPVTLTTDGYGNVYVQSSWTDDYQNNFVSVGGMTVIDSKTDAIKAKYTPDNVNNFNTTIPIAINGDMVYYSFNQKVAVFDAKTQTQVRANFVTDGTNIVWPLAISVDHATGEVYIADAGKGTDSDNQALIDVFDKTGKLEYSFKTAIDPVKMILVN